MRQDAAGNIEVWVTIDDVVVPITNAGSGTHGDDGRVTLCEQEYTRRVTDQEGGDGVDREDDYIRTRHANGFNWLAIDTGSFYDNPANRNNILDIDVHAILTETPTCAQGMEVLGQTCAQAIIGNRTLVIEPTKLSIHEQITEQDGDSVPPGN